MIRGSGLRARDGRSRRVSSTWDKKLTWDSSVVYNKQERKPETHLMNQLEPILRCIGLLSRLRNTSVVT